MDRYSLVKLVQWCGSGGLQGRKRLQKVVFFLQRAGCPVGAEYALHHYGPYSRDVAETCDDLVAMGLLEERASGNAQGGTQYTYTLAAAGESAVSQVEKKQGEGPKTFAEFKPLADELLLKELWELELGSTILFFRDRVSDWDEAIRRACEFKKVERQKNAAAEALAKKLFDQASVG